MKGQLLKLYCSMKNKSSCIAQNQDLWVGIPIILLYIVGCQTTRRKKFYRKLNTNVVFLLKNVNGGPLTISDPRLCLVTLNYSDFFFICTINLPYIQTSSFSRLDIIKRSIIHMKYLAQWFHQDLLPMGKGVRAIHEQNLSFKI